MFQTLQKIWKLLSGKERAAFFIIVIMMVIGALLELLGIGMILPVIAALSEPKLIEQNRFLKSLYDIINPGSNEKFILALCLILSIIFILKNCYLTFLAKVQASFVFRKAAEMSAKLFDNYIKAPYVFHLQKNSSVLMNNITLITLVANSFLLPFMMLLAELIVIAAIFILLLAFKPFTTLILVILTAGIGILIYYPLRKFHYFIGTRLRLYNMMILRNIMQGLEAVKESKIRNCEDFFSRAHADNQVKLKQADMLSYFTGQIPRFLIEALVIFAGMGTLAVFVLMGVPSASIVMSLSLLAIAMLRLMPSFSRIQYYLTTIRHSDCAFEEIYHDLMEISPEPKNSDKPPVKLEKSIRIDNLSFSYQDGNKIFEKFNVEIPHLSSVAFIGPTGCGKTTLIDIILGLLKPEEGKILVDGRDIEENLASWQKSIGYVPQFIYLTDDSIKVNVAFGVPEKNIDDERIKHCLKMAQILDFVEGLPDGINTLTGERGVRLSGGQRQRIGIARALYYNPEVLVLDEATSALDNETEKAFVDALGALKGKLTMIIIAHRLTTVENCDIKINLK